MSDITLPKIPSQLLKLAVADMKEVVGQGLTIDMRSWAKSDSDKICSVCMAGAVMLNTLDASWESESDTPSAHDGFYTYLKSSVNKNQLLALDIIREGNLLSFMEYLDIPYTKEKHKYEEGYTSYILYWKDYDECESLEEFTDQIEELIIYLENKGL